MNKRDKIIAIVLTLLLALGILGAAAATPAQADNKVCTTISQMPKQVVTNRGVQVMSKARSFCVGWGNTSRYELKTWTVEKVGAGKTARWVPSPHLSSSTGKDSATFYTRNVPKRSYRTYSQLTIKNSSGIVIKKYGVDQSAAISW